MPSCVGYGASQIVEMRTLILTAVGFQKSGKTAGEKCDR